MSQSDMFNGLGSGPAACRNPGMILPPSAHHTQYKDCCTPHGARICFKVLPPPPPLLYPSSPSILIPPAHPFFLISLPSSLSRTVAPSPSLALSLALSLSLSHTHTHTPAHPLFHALCKEGREGGEEEERRWGRGGGRASLRKSEI